MSELIDNLISIKSVLILSELNLVIKCGAMRQLLTQIWNKNISMLVNSHFSHTKVE